MCECGCGDFHPDRAWKLGDKTLAVEVYPSCSNCDTPAGVWLHLMTPKACADWDLQATEEFSIKPEDYGTATQAIEVLHPDDLVEVAKELEQTEIDIAEYDTLADLLKDHGQALLEMAIHRCLDRNRSANKGGSDQQHP